MHAQRCGEEHEESVSKCTTGTCGVEIELDDGGEEEEEEAEVEEALSLRHLHDVRPYDEATGDETGEAVYIGTSVKLIRPGTDDVVGRGKVHALGLCSGKAPATVASMRAAPAGSCFVLVLNDKTIEVTISLRPPLAFVKCLSSLLPLSCTPSLSLSLPGHLPLPGARFGAGDAQLPGGAHLTRGQGEAGAGAWPAAGRQPQARDRPAAHGGYYRGAAVQRVGRDAETSAGQEEGG